ncbi:MAG: hydrogenase formation protein HypD [Nitrospiraceae bacterium]|nr:hydrogenase formation protein HypD [Nitrospiraceae bacterium]
MESKGEIERLASGINSLLKKVGRPVKLMEVCGTHTVAIFRQGLRGLFPGISFLSGPGCPVCVTAKRDIDCSIMIAKQPDVTLMTFGDMMRVPGALGTLNGARAEGADVKVVYSPLDAVSAAEKERGKNRKIVFFATGFETTIPLVAAALELARGSGLDNFFIYSVHKLVPPALRALLSVRKVDLDGFILPGHVSAIIGASPYGFLAEDFHIPAVVTGFEAEEIMEGVLMLLEQITSRSARVEVAYKKVVKDAGNQKALFLMDKYFEPVDAEWRGIGTIPASGLKLKEEWKAMDAESFFDFKLAPHVSSGTSSDSGCSCGDILRGLKLPVDCRLFGSGCTPDHPLGACMVSTEGSCAAYYKYGAFIKRNGQ